MMADSWKWLTHPIEDLQVVTDMIHGHKSNMRALATLSTRPRTNRTPMHPTKTAIAESVMAQGITWEEGRDQRRHNANRLE
jgi:hypothetical protein